jgi:hypothetical protein
MPLAGGPLQAWMRRYRLTVVAIAAVCLSSMFELATLDLGHELTWFGHLSQEVSAWLRYCLFTGTTVLVVPSVIYRRDGRSAEGK